MTIDSKEAYVRYRLQRAEESYDDACILAENGRWNSTLNRLYYAGFYAVIALLMKNNIQTQTHDGARTQLGLHFIKTGIIDIEFGKLYSKLFDLRQKGDYGDLFDFDGDTVNPLIESTREFLDVIKKHI